MFSNDIVGVVASYALYPVPTPPQTATTATASETDAKTSAIADTGPVTAPLTAVAKALSRPQGTAICKHVLTFGCPGMEDGQFDRGCWDVAMDTAGRIWVSDERGVQVFSSDFEFLYHAAIGEFKQGSCGIAFNKQGETFIADALGHRIVVCSAQGKFLRAFGREGTKQCEFNNPWFVPPALFSLRSLVFSFCCVVVCFCMSSCVLSVLVGALLWTQKVT